jgi:hypothetical protein
MCEIPTHNMQRTKSKTKLKAPYKIIGPIESKLKVLPIHIMKKMKVRMGVMLKLRTKQ